MDIPKLMVEYRQELERKGYRPKSIDNYVCSIGIFLNHFRGRKDCEHINQSDIKNYLHTIRGHNTQRSHHSSIKCFYRYVCHQPDKFRYIEYCRRDRRLPIVLSVDEMSRLIIAAENLKHKTIICLMYATGMRVGEVINLKIENIDSSRKIINIIDAKGGEDRQVPLDLYLLTLLREYWKQYRSKEYLFEGQCGAAQYTESSIRQFIKDYAAKAGINKRIHPHLIRHCHATHLLEAGTEMSIIQKILGHKNIKTTQVYSHISHNLISSVPTPLSLLANRSDINKKLLKDV